LSLSLSSLFICVLQMKILPENMVDEFQIREKGDIALFDLLYLAGCPH
jgi:hypothetical protein